MFIKQKPMPPGCNPPSKEDRMPVAQVISGDTWEISAALVAADGGPASPENSHVEFVLSENQFSPPLWTGLWNAGILPYENRPGFVRVKIPQDFTKKLRRGSYMFSIRVSDRMRHAFNTQAKGYFLVEYMPTSDQHSIPYRDGTSERFPSDVDDGSSDPTPEEENGLYAREVTTGLYHKIVAVRDQNTSYVYLGVD